MAFLERNGVRLYYEVHGSGTPIILTHGYSSTSTMWRGQINAFVSKGYRLIIWDMRGHGKSSYPEDQSLYSEEHTVADIAAILNHVLGSGIPAIVGGLSLGGYMSLAFFCVHPQRVKILLIIDTGPGFKSDAAREAWNRTARETGRRFDEDGLAHLSSSGMTPERRIVHHRDSKGLAKAARGMLAQRNAAVIESLPRVAVPTLVVVGGDDKPFLAASEYMAKKIPQAQKVVVPNAGHAVNLDQPKAFNAAVLKFLSEVNANTGLAKL
jgi:pimeloyl-ACP methyl ester carboxylesterase